MARKSHLVGIQRETTRAVDTQALRVVRDDTMATSDGGNASDDEESDDEAQRSSSGSDDDDDSSEASGSSGSDDSSEASSSNEEDDDEDDDDTQARKQALVRSDIDAMRSMVGEIEKIKARLQFRLARESQAMRDEAHWKFDHPQQVQRSGDTNDTEQHAQVSAAEHQPRKRTGANDATKLEQNGESTSAIANRLDHTQQSTHGLAHLNAQQQQSHHQHAQDRNEQLHGSHAQALPMARSLVEIGVQTDATTAATHNEHEASIQHSVAATAPTHEQANRQVPQSTQQTASRSRRSNVQASAHASDPPGMTSEETSARLSLFDLGKSYGLSERAASQKPRTTAPPVPAVSRVGDIHEPTSALPLSPPSEASDSETFFIRRDSNRSSWHADAPHDTRPSSLEQSHDSLSGSEFSPDAQPGSPVSERSSNVRESAFQTLRNSILSSIYEGSNSNNSVSAMSKLFGQRASYSILPPSSPRVASPSDKKTDAQREREAIQSLLFDR